MKKKLIILLKIGISVAILWYLVQDARSTKVDGQDIFQRLRDQQKHWGMLAAAWFCCAAAVTLTIVRWWYLVRALDIPFRFRDGLRIGFLGYLVNFAPMGIVGGDLIKGWMLARQNRRDQLPQAVASVVVDRLIGLYMLLVFASAAILATGFLDRPLPDKVRQICNLTFVATGVGAVLIAIVLGPDLNEGRTIRALGRIPKVGPAIQSVVEAVRMYRHKLHVLAAACLMSVAVHAFFATGVWLIARGLPGDVLSLSTHFVVGPLSALTGVIPLPLGPFEFVLEFLYTQVALLDDAINISKGQGLVVALGYRLIGLLIATVGIWFYISNRRELAQAAKEARRGDTNAS